MHSEFCRVRRSTSMRKANAHIAKRIISDTLRVCAQVSLRSFSRALWEISDGEYRRESENCIESSCSSTSRSREEEVVQRPNIMRKRPDNPKAIIIVCAGRSGYGHPLIFSIYQLQLEIQQ